MHLRWAMLIAAALLSVGAGCGSDRVPDYFETDTTCDLLGPGAIPDGGKGTLNDPYRIDADVQYAGCAKPNVIHGPVYGTVVPAGKYEIRQSDGVTDMRLLFYDRDGQYVGATDDEPAGVDETITTPLLPDTAFGVEVFNKDSGDGPFSLIVTTLP